MHSLLARVGKTAHPNDMLAMLSGTRSPYSSTAYCSPCEKGNVRCKCDIVRILPRRLLLPWRHTFTHKMQRRIVVLPCWLGRAECRRPWHVHKPQAHSDDFMRRRLLLFERTSPQVSIRIVLSRWCIQSHRRQSWHIHRRKQNKRCILRARVLLQERHQA